VELVGAAVVKAVEKELYEVIVMRATTRLMIALSVLAPRLFERIVGRLDLAAPFRTVADRRSAANQSSG
jgi:hypothetical protein